MSEGRTLAAVALAGALAGALVMWGVSRSLSTSGPEDSKRETAKQCVIDHDSAKRSAQAESRRGDLRVSDLMSDDILHEHFQRNIQFFGEEAQMNIAKSFVVVVGLGGVGSHAAHMLLRSGVGKLRLVDFDQVTLSSLNRHCLATRADVGISKAECLARHFREIVPECDIEVMVRMYDADSEEDVLAGNPDYVLDAIDNIDTKVDLLAACVRRGLRVLASGGAGARADPTRLVFSDLSEMSQDNLGRAVKYRLRKQHGIEEGVEMLISSEKPTVGLVSLEAMQSGNPLDYQIVPNFRVRTIPVLGTSPTLFGVAAAARILTNLAGQPFNGHFPRRIDQVEMERMVTRLEGREEQRHGEERLGVMLADVEFLVKDVYRARSAISGKGYADKGVTRNISRLHLTRWDKRKGSVVDNLVLMEKEEADEHDELENMGDVERRWGKEVCARIEGILDGVRRAYTAPNSW